MLRIKLARFGKKKQPQYRVLVLERSKDPWGDALENVGTYNPLTKPATMNLNEERIKYWLSKGAQPTDSMHNILVGAGIIEGKKRNVSALGKEVRTKREEEKKKISDEKVAAKKAAVEAKKQAETPAAPAEAAK